MSSTRGLLSKGRHAGSRGLTGAKALLAAVAILGLSPCAISQPRVELAPGQDARLDVHARIARVEQGLSTPVVVKGAPNRRMRLVDRMAFHRIPAVSIAVINNGRVEWVRAYGELESGSKRIVTPDTLFQAGSVSKTLTAMAALRLVEEGRLSLDADANTQLKSWQIPASRFTQERPVTLRRLLNHSAGMNVHGFLGYAQGAAVPSLLQVLDGVAPANSEAVRVESTPGSQWSYSGGGYSVAQLMMTEAGQQPFPELMRALVLAPLQMHDSSFAMTLPATWQARTASGYHSDGEPVAGRWHVYPESAAAALWATPGDLAKVVVDIQQAQGGAPGKVLSPAMTATLLRRDLGDYGLGLFVEKVGDGTSFGHSGGTDGFRTQLYGYTHTGQGAVVMTNSDNGAALIDELLISIAAEYGWPEFNVIEKTAVTPNPGFNAAVAGEYQLHDKPAHVIAEGDRLYFQSDLFGAERMELFAQSNTRFFFTAKDMSLDFQLDESGRASAFSLLRNGARHAGVRKE